MKNSILRTETTKNQRKVFFSAEGSKNATKGAIFKWQLIKNLRQENHL